MKQVLLAICAINIVFLCYCGKPAEKQPGKDEAAIKNIITDFYKKFDYKDFPGMMAYCRDDFQWYSINGMILKKDNIEAFFTPIISEWKSMVTEVMFFETQIDGNLAVIRFGTRIKINSDIKDMKNLHTMVFIYQFGEWKLWHHHESTQ